MKVQVPDHTAAESGELKKLLRLSLPLVAGYAGHQLMSFVDTAMVGRLGRVPLSAISVGGTLYFAITVFGMGCVRGLETLASQAVGAREEGTARRLMWQGARLGLWLSLPLTAILALVPPVLEPVGIGADIALDTSLYVAGRLPGVLPFLWFTAVMSYMQAKHITRPIVLSVIVANVVNVLANALLIFGDQALEFVGLQGMGLPALGTLGAGLASSVSTVVSLLVLVAAVRRIDAPADPKRRRADRGLLRRVLRLGAPVGAQLAAEVGVFSLVSVLAAKLGALPGSGHQVALTLASFTFTVSLGISSATSVRVGFHVGRGDTPAARRAGLLGLASSGSFMVLSALMFISIPGYLASIVTDKAAVIAAAEPLLMVAAVFQLSDGTQVVAAGALRGAGDTATAMYANLVGHWVLGLPVAAGLAFGLDLGARGLWWGLSLGLTVVAVVLAWRFLKVSSRPIARS